LLDSFQIEAMLIARDMTRTAAKADRTKAHGYKAPGLRHPIYVRIGGPEGRPQPVATDQLALHPDDVERLRTHDLVPAGVSFGPSSNPSSAYKEFPPRYSKGKISSYEGIRVSIEDESALQGLLAALGHLFEPPAEADLTPLEAAARRCAEQDLGSDPKAGHFGPTTRRALVDARIGQGAFRRRMMRVWDNRCAVTGCAVPAALVASHAVAWSLAEPREQLDEYNGLLLTASIDRLFDKGLISFGDDGRLLCKPGLSEVDLANLGLRSDARLRADHLHARHRPYLAAHRVKHDF
jgi:hypothetical protein